MFTFVLLYYNSWVLQEHLSMIIFLLKRELAQFWLYPNDVFLIVSIAVLAEQLVCNTVKHSHYDYVYWRRFTVNTYSILIVPNKWKVTRFDVFFRNITYILLLVLYCKQIRIESWFLIPVCYTRSYGPKGYGYGTGAGILQTN